MKYFLKKLAIISIALICSLITIHLLLKVFLGNINYPASFNIQYHQHKNNIQVIENQGFSLQTPKFWLNIALKPDCPGYVGYFLTYNGLIGYEYGMYIPIFDKPDYSIQKQQINKFTIHIITEKVTGYQGIRIPCQNNMKFSMVFYPSQACSKNLMVLLKSFETISFK